MQDNGDRSYLLNTIYKIFANILAKRVKPYLHDLIYVGQTMFMENRCIIDNVLTFWEVIALAKKSNQHIAYLMLDFEKAYDRVQWPYLENVMEGLGLPSKWRSVVLALYKESLSMALVSGHRGISAHQFHYAGLLGRGVHWPPTFIYLFQRHSLSF